MNMTDDLDTDPTYEDTASPLNTLISDQMELKSKVCQKVYVYMSSILRITFWPLLNKARDII